MTPCDAYTRRLEFIIRLYWTGMYVVKKDARRYELGYEVK